MAINQQRTPVSLIRGDAVDVKTDYRDLLNVNMVPVMRQIHGAQGYLVTYPGLVHHATAPFGADRGGVYNERFATHFRVSSNQLYKVASDGTVVTLGGIGAGGQVAMPYSFQTQAVIGWGKMSLYDPINGLVPVTDPDLGAPIDGTWINGYYFLTDGENIYHTDITDETSISPLKFATAEFSPDPSLGVLKTQDNKVAVFGRYSIEYFVDQASENFAFTRVESRAQKIGIVATHAKVEHKGVFYICGGRKDESLGIHAVTLGGSEKISSREVDKILSAYAEPDLVDIRMEARHEDDVSFLLVHLPNETLCYNLNVAALGGKDFAWTLLQTGKDGAPHRAINGVFEANLGKWIYGDKSADGHVGILDKSIGTQYGDPQELIFYTPFLDVESDSIDEVELETIPGFTTTDDAAIAFSMTKDGVNYGTEYWQMYGLPLDYSMRWILRRMGYVAQWVGFKFRSYTKSRLAIATCWVTHG